MLEDWISLAEKKMPTLYTTVKLYCLLVLMLHYNRKYLALSGWNVMLMVQLHPGSAK